MPKKKTKKRTVISMVEGESAHFMANLKMSSDFNGWGFSFGVTMNRAEGESYDELGHRVADHVMLFCEDVEERMMTELGNLVTIRKKLHERTSGRGR